MNKLIYLTPEAPREGQASYTHVHEIIAGLKRRGWDVTLYQPSYTKKPSSPGLFGRLLESLRMQIMLWLRWPRGATIYVRAHYLSFPSAFIARLFGIKIVHEINGPYEDAFVAHPALNRVRRPLIWLQRWQFRHAVALIAVTEDLRLWAARESNGRRSVLIPNGANTDFFRPNLPKPQNLPARYAFFFGGLTAWHGVDTMIAAAAHTDWPTDIALVVAGDGQGMAALRDAVKSNPRLHLLGKLDYRAIPPLAANALCGLVPISNPNGRSETGLLPLKLFETLAAGAPVIVTDFPGQADLVRANDCGLVIPPDDPGALARAVATLATDPVAARAMGARGATLVKAEHSWDARAAVTDKLLLNL